MAHLFHLVRFCFCAGRLQIQDFLHVLFAKDMMIPAHALIKSQAQEQMSQVRKRYVCIRCPPHNAIQDFVMSSHMRHFIIGGLILLFDYLLTQAIRLTGRRNCHAPRMTPNPLRPTHHITSWYTTHTVRNMDFLRLILTNGFCGPCFRPCRSFVKERLKCFDIRSHPLPRAGKAFQQCVQPFGIQTKGIDIRCA